MKEKSTINRRTLICRSGQLAAAGLLGSLATQAGATGTFTMPASTTKLCGTCKYWGGVRLVSTDKKTVSFEGLGYCNNPKSPNYQKSTTPETGPMAVWEKWDALN